MKTENKIKRKRRKLTWAHTSSFGPPDEASHAAQPRKSRAPDRGARLTAVCSRPHYDWVAPLGLWFTQSAVVRYFLTRLAHFTAAGTLGTDAADSTRGLNQSLACGTHLIGVVFFFPVDLGRALTDERRRGLCGVSTATPAGVESPARLFTREKPSVLAPNPLCKPDRILRNFNRTRQWWALCGGSVGWCWGDKARPRGHHVLPPPSRTRNPSLATSVEQSSPSWGSAGPWVVALAASWDFPLAPLARPDYSLVVVSVTAAPVRALAGWDCGPDLRQFLAGAAAPPPRRTTPSTGPVLIPTLGNTPLSSSC
jgi:hypothetical protein